MKEMTSFGVVTDFDLESLCKQVGAQTTVGLYPVGGIAVTHVPVEDRPKGQEDCRFFYAIAVAEVVDVEEPSRILHG